MILYKRRGRKRNESWLDMANGIATCEYIQRCAKRWNVSSTYRCGLIRNRTVEQCGLRRQYEAEGQKENSTEKGENASE